MIEASPLIFNLQSAIFNLQVLVHPEHPRFRMLAPIILAISTVSASIFSMNGSRRSFPAKPQPDARLLELLPCDLQLVHEIGIRLRLARLSRAFFDRIYRINKITWPAKAKKLRTMMWNDEMLQHIIIGK